MPGEKEKAKRAHQDSQARRPNDKGARRPNEGDTGTNNRQTKATLEVVLGFPGEGATLEVVLGFILAVRNPCRE